MSIDMFENFLPTNQMNGLSTRLNVWTSLIRRNDACQATLQPRHRILIYKAVVKSAVDTWAGVELEGLTGWILVTPDGEVVFVDQDRVYSWLQPGRVGFL